MALTPEQLAAIKAGLMPQYSATGGGEAGSSTYIPSQFTYNGINYVPNGQGGYWGFADNPQFDTGSTTAGYNGTPYTSYDASGQENGSGKLSGIKNDNFMSTYGPFAMLAAGMAPAVLGVGAAGAGAAGGATDAAGAGGAAFNAAADSQAANAAIQAAGGDALGGYTAAGTGGVDLGAAGVAGDAGGGALQTFGAMPQVTVPAASTFPELSTGGSILDGIFGGSAPSWLKVAAPILGAIAGSKGVKTNSTQTSNINPQVAPYVYGSGGLLGGVQNLLGQQTGNGAQQVQQAGLGLLNQPVAGNGFSRFFPNR